MKMNKIIIPTVAIAMGAALVGSVSSTLAWYQYSTKAQAAYIGTSIGESENLEIKVKDGNGGWKWVTNAKSSDIEAILSDKLHNGSNMIPITPAVADEGNLGSTDALPAKFYKSVETGVGGVETYGNRYSADENYIQFDLYMRYRQTSYRTSTDNADANTFPAKAVNLVDLTIIDAAGQNGAKDDLYKAVRVHFSAPNGNSLVRSLFAADDSSDAASLTTATYGALDTDNDHKLDKRLGYEWETDLGDNIVYGIDGSEQSALNAHVATNFNNRLIGVIPQGNNPEFSVTITIWLEGWQKLSHTTNDNYDLGEQDDPTTENVDESRDAEDSAIWDPASYSNKQFKIGMRFQAVDVQ